MDRSGQSTSNYNWDILRKKRTTDRTFYDAFECQKYLLTGLPSENPVIFDVGANRGQTVARYRAVLPNSTIHSFEPFPDSFQALQKSTQGDERCICVNAAVADRPGMRKFYVQGLDGANSLLPRPHLQRRYYPKEAAEESTTEVKTITLDDYVRDNRIERVEILKMDIQGGELLALTGAHDILSKSLIPIIYTEVVFVPHYEGGAMMYEVWSRLEEYGYSLYNMFNLYRAHNGQLRQADVIFIANWFRSQFIDKQPEEP
jgi:FkbM family methyltransferase